MFTFSSSFLLAALFCYLVGSIPTGYLLVKAAKGKDITKEGSGNVGTLNAFLVSKSKRLGALVLILDFLKGSLPVIILLYLLKLNPIDAMFSSCFIILGHNYSIWLKFKGGRGLASSAGILAVINYVLLATWCLIWLISYAIKRAVLISNVAATVLIPVLILIFRRLYYSVIVPALPENSFGYFFAFILVIVLLVLIKHRSVFNTIIPSLEKD